MKQLLYVAALLMNADHKKRGDNFDQRPFFRYLNMVFYGWHDYIRGEAEQDQMFVLTFGEVLLLLEPARFPIFIFSWLTLLSNQAFMPAILKIAGQEVSLRQYM